VALGIEPRLRLARLFVDADHPGLRHLSPLSMEKARFHVSAAENRPAGGLLDRPEPRQL
jgi:hypothetical protein